MSTPHQMERQRADYAAFKEWSVGEAAALPDYKRGPAIRIRVRQLRISAALRGCDITGQQDFDAFVREHGRGRKTGPLK